MITTFSDAFVRVAEPHMGWVVEQLETFQGFLPDAPWTADLEQGVYRQGEREVRVGVLGTYDETDRSWMWALANPGFAGTAAVAAANAVRDVGLGVGVPEFTEDVIDLSGFPDPRIAAETLACAAMGVLGATGYLGLDAGPGVRVYLVPEDPRVPRAPLVPAAVPRVLLAGAGVFGASPRRVVTGYFRHHGLTAERSPDRISARTADGVAIEVPFDAAGRIASVEVRGIGAEHSG
ncbi:DUF6882 domain-containing protein [Streptomyces sp. NPDC002851]